MKPRLFVLLFIAALLLVLVTIAAACGDDDGAENDEDAIRDTIQEALAACNAGDSERANELQTATGPGCPTTPDPNAFEIVAVTVDGDVATVEGILTDNAGETYGATGTLRKEDGRWLVHRVD